MKFKNRTDSFLLFTAAFLFFIFYSPLTVTAQKSKEIIPVKDYSKWEKLIGYSLSDDGKWLTYSVSNDDYDSFLYYYDTKKGIKKEIKNAGRGNISNDGRWLGFSKYLPGKELKKLEKKRKKAKDKSKYVEPYKIGLTNLITGDTLEFKDVQGFKFSGKGNYIAMKYPRNKSNMLIVKNLNGKDEISFGNVIAYNWEDKGNLLALITETKDSLANAVKIFNPVTGNIKILDNKRTTYKNLKWKKDSDDLSVLRVVKDKNFKDNTFDLMVWTGMDSGKPQLKIFDQTAFSNFPKDTRILNSGIKFSDDWKSIYFTTFSRQKSEDRNKDKEADEKKEKDYTDDDEAPDLEIWNSKDVVMISAQKKSKMKDLEKPMLAVWNLTANKFTRLEDDLTEKVMNNTENRIVLGLDQTPYDFDAMFGRPYDDIYTVDKITGKKNKVLTKIVKAWSVSPDNKYFVYVKDDDLYLFDIPNGRSRNLTKGLDAVFIRESDHPLPQQPPYGFKGWSKDSKSFFFYSEFDVWQGFPGGKESRRITQGKEKEIQYRVMSLDRDEKYIDDKTLQYFSMDGKWTKKTGIAKGKIGGKIKTMIYEDAIVGRLKKAENADVMVFKKESYEQAPNLYLTGSELRSFKKISAVNDFQKDYAWGRAELVDFINTQGKRSQGILYYPANYVKGKKYPMITYVYERLSDRIHFYEPPSRTRYYNTTVWLQNGYFVFKPDIEFTPGDPGISSTRTLEKAVKAVTDKGDVDPAKVGLVGHSWGGYQAGFVPTQTNIFAATVAGAGLTELISMYLAVTPAFGGRPENDHFEVGQERMLKTPWETPENYINNSPVMQIEKLNTPILFEVGEEDENVNWTQGVAYYNAARRAGKPFILLVYAKEGHSLRSKKNQIDYQQRILKWFGHYLKGEEAEDWMIKGIPYAEQQRRLKNRYKK